MSDPQGAELPAPPAKGLHAKIAEVMVEMDRMPKTGWNDHHKYSFVTESDVADALRMALGKRKVTALPKLTKAERVPVPTSSGKETGMWWVEMVFTLTDAETGDSIELPWAGVAFDADDKGLNKAITSAMKYFLVKAFLISTGDPESDHTGVEVGGQVGGARQQPQGQQQQRQFGNRGGGGGGTISEGQQRLVFGRGMSKGLSGDEVRRFVLEATGKEVEDLTRPEVDPLLAQFDKYAETGEWPSRPSNGQPAAPERGAAQARTRLAIERFNTLRQLAQQIGASDTDLKQAMSDNGLRVQIDLVDELDHEDTSTYDLVRRTLLATVGADDPDEAPF